MVIGYKYKIQWLCHQYKQAKTLVDALGAKSLDLVRAKDKNMKNIDSYDSMVMYPHGLADIELKKWMRATAKRRDFYSFEFIRK